MTMEAVLCFRAFLLCFLTGLVSSQPSTVRLLRTWQLNQSDHILRYGRESVLRLILLREAGNTTFACGFYCEAGCGGPSHLLSVLIVSSYAPTRRKVDAKHKPKVVLSANRNSLVTVDASLELAENGDLVLKYPDEEKAVWSTGTTGRRVVGINLTDLGNLVLFDDSNATVWQSLDHPTDTLLIGQKLTTGKKLVPSISETNWTEHSLFSLSLTNHGLYALVGSKPQLSYYTFLFELSDTAYLEMANGTLALSLNNSAIGKENQALCTNPDAVSALYIRLGSDGHLRAHGYDVIGGFIDMGDMLPLRTCEYPTYCGPYGICSSGGCSCPPPSAGVAYYNPLNYRRPELGCSANTPLTCDDRHFHHFLRIEGVGYFDFVTDIAGVDAKDCTDACARSCSCKAAFFRRGINSSSGDCFLPSELLSLRQLDAASYRDHNDTVYLKVQMMTSMRFYPRIQSSKESKKKIFSKKIVVLGAGIAFLTLTMAAFFIVRSKKKVSDRTEDNELMTFFTGMPTRFSYADLKSITEDFSKKLGEGGFGSVFEGALPDGTKVAVKCLVGSGKVKKTFINEVETIGSIHHVNLVKLLGFCAEKSYTLLVFEYMSNGSLDKWIFGESTGLILDWSQKMAVILDIAKGLHYLHEECDQKIVHFDIKPQNVLLDDNFRAKISDFGLSKPVDREKGEIMTTMRGTPGYLAPEWLNGAVTEKADVYGFGMVILETFCGRKVHSNIRQDSEDSDGLLKLFQRKVEEGRPMDIIQARVKPPKDDLTIMADLSRAMRLAACCLQTNYRKRPSMSTAIKVLDGVMKIEEELVYDFTHPVAGAGFNADASASTIFQPSVLSGPR